MGFETMKRHLVSNKTLIWKVLQLTRNYSVCTVGKNTIFNGSIIKNNGINNQILVEDGAKVSFCTFSINGNNNTILIKKNAVINGCVFLVDDDFNEIHIGENSTFTGRTELITTEGTRIIVGHDCMFAYGIVVRTGDHHSLLGSKGERINMSKSISIGNHVWVGQNAFLLKGAEIQDGCVIGACSVVTRGSTDKNAVLAGNPAKVIRSEVLWVREQI